MTELREDESESSDLNQLPIKLPYVVKRWV